jgi:uncharacterized short protein YbdD (DUF466 family)
MFPPGSPKNGCGIRLAMSRLMNPLSRLRRLIRAMAGEDAYERYLVHWREQHSGDGTPLDRKTFYKQQQERKWNGINRCC